MTGRRPARPAASRLTDVGQVPAATRALRLLRYLAGQPDPVTLDRLAAAVGLPRSTAYHLVNAMIEEGFVVHLPEEHRYGLGVAAFEVGSGYARQAPLQMCSTCWRSGPRPGRPW
jgi:DNA-binding IclR family transcriptional regulator